MASLLFRCTCKAAGYGEGRGERLIEKNIKQKFKFEAGMLCRKKEIIKFMTRSNELEGMYSIQKNTFKY